MTLDDLVEAHLRGDDVAVPDELRADFDCAVRARAALDYALGETLIAATGVPARTPPHLPSDYEIVGEVGSGGMGVVYRARQRSLGRDVAVKVLRPGEATFGPLIGRFLDEARHLARLRHPNIVAIHEVGDADGEPYFTMDFIEGRPLSAELARGALPPARALAILEQVADGVAHAHAHGIIHRDLKPANVLLDAGGRVFVSDFGLARDMTQMSDRTQSGQLLGTPAYMAPEQALGQADRVGEATDVHGLGVLLYEMLTGRAPYGSDAPARVLARLLHEEPSPPRKLDRRIPRALETVCLKALAKRPEQRYATVRALREDLRRFAAGAAVLARPVPVWARGGRWLRRRWPTAAAVAATTVVVAVVASRLASDPVQELATRADGYLAAGEPTLAVRYYRDAWGAADVERRPRLLARMQAAVAAIADTKAAMSAAETVLACAPDASLGRLDYALAMAAVSRAQARAAADPAGDETRALLRGACARLRVFLAGEHGSADERQRAQAALASSEELAQRDWVRDERGVPVAWMTPGEPEPVAVDVRRLIVEAFLQETLPRIEGDSTLYTDLPEGDAAFLEARADDASDDRWQRGKAAYAAGLAHERAGDPASAARCFRTGYELLRAEFPIYAWHDGFRVSLGDEPGVPAAARGCAELLRRAHDAVRRTTPRAADALRGGLRFRLEGPALPEGLLLRLVDCVRHPDDSSGHTALPRDFYSVSFDGTADQAWLGVADGVYRPVIGMLSHQTSNPEAARFGECMKLDTDWPERVEVRGDTVELVVHLRLVGAIEPERPADAAYVDLENDVFRWSAVEGARSYRVRFERPTATDGVVETAFIVPINAVCVGTLPDRAGVDWAHYTPGTRVQWQVEALDGDDRVIGKMLRAASFLVSRGPR